MSNFKSFVAENTLNEFGFVGRLVTSIKMKIQNAMRRLGFGRKVRIPLGKIMTEAVDMKSRLGYLSEYATAMELAKVIHDAGGRLTARSTPEKTAQIYAQKKRELEQLKANAEQIRRQETGGKELADKIFKDAIYPAEDFPLLEWDIEMTGDSGKGETKGDVTLTVTKDDQRTVVDKIIASLKVYEKAQINLANNTFVSLIKVLFYDNPSDADRVARGAEDFVQQFAKEFGSPADIKKLLDLQLHIPTRMKQGLSKADARAEAKGTHKEVIATLIKIFNDHYKSHKKAINERMLKNLGFDGADDFYAAVGKADNQKVLSSRSSAEFKRLVDQLTGGFTLNLTRIGETNQANIQFVAPNREVITNIKVSFTDTGGSAHGKTNAWMDLKNYM